MSDIDLPLVCIGKLQSGVLYVQWVMYRAISLISDVDLPVTCIRVIVNNENKQIVVVTNYFQIT